MMLRVDYQDQLFVYSRSDSLETKNSGLIFEFRQNITQVT
jgi:hypothetical protein